MASPNITLITYSGSLVTPQHDALIHDQAVTDGIFYGIAASVLGTNTLEVTSGVGIVHGREFEVEQGDITVQLPNSGTLQGRLYVHIDLDNQSTPIELVAETGSTLSDLTDDPDINAASGETDLELYRFTVSPIGIDVSSLTRVVSDAQADGEVKTVSASGTDLNDYVDTGIYYFGSDQTPANIPVGVNGFLQVLSTSQFVKQIWYRTGTPGTNDHQTFVRTKNSSGWGAWDKYVTERWLPDLAHITTYATAGEGDGVYFGGGGTTIISGGEAAQAIVANDIHSAAAGTSENVHVAADNTVYLYSNCNTIANRKEFVFTAAGNLEIPGTLKEGNNTVYPIKVTDVEINLKNASWSATQSGNGMYYTEASVSGFAQIYAVSICNWAVINKDVIIMPYISSASKVALMCSTNSFSSASSLVKIRVVGRPS